MSDDDVAMESLNDVSSTLMSTAAVFARSHSLSVDQVSLFRHEVDDRWELIVIATDERAPKLQLFFTDGTVVTEPLSKLSDEFRELLIDLADVSDVKNRVERHQARTHGPEDNSRVGRILLGLGVGITAIGLVEWWRRR